MENTILETKTLQQLSLPLRFWKAAQLELRMAGLVLVLMIVLTWLSPHFLSLYNIFNLMDQTVVIGMASLGATLVILTGGIDLSIGSVVGLSGVVMATTFIRFGVFPSLVLCLLAGVLAGLINGILVTKAKLAPFVATLGMMSIARSQAYILSGAKSMHDLPPVLESMGNSSVMGLPSNFISLIVLYILMWLFLNRTKLGRSIYAVGSNEEAARVAGVAVNPVKIFCYACSGLFGAVACLFLASRILSVDPLGGNSMELDTIAAIVIGGSSLNGGRGSIIGTLFGVFVMVLIRNGLNLLKVDPYWQGTAIGSVIIAALLLESFFRNSNRKKA